MRNGKMEVEVDGDRVGIVFTGEGTNQHYCAFDMNPSEAELLGKLLLDGAKKATPALASTRLTAAMNQLDSEERSIITGGT